MSKLILFDFECRGGHRFEALVKSDVHSTPCQICGQPAQRQISAPRIDRLRMAVTGDSTTAVDYFDHVHRERRAIEERNKANHGDYGKPAGAD